MSETRKRRTLVRQRDRLVRHLEDCLVKSREAMEEYIAIKSRIDTLDRRLANAVEFENGPLATTLCVELATELENRTAIEKNIERTDTRAERAVDKLRAWSDAHLDFKATRPN